MAWSLRTLPTLSEDQFSQWGKLLEERTGIQLVFQQKAWLESQMSSRMRELGFEDYDHYYLYVTHGLEGKLEWTRLIDRIAVKETSFFRHRDSIEYVRQYLQNKINNQTLHNSFDVWSLGCATGEEPYSLAMVINDCFELAMLDPYYGITAMDISSSALAAGRKARYSKRRIEQIKPEEIKRYMHQCADGSFEVVGKLRDRVCFTQANIIHARQLPHVKVDVIFCQNLLVYFRRWLRRDVLNALIDRLKPGGLLVVGLGETVDWEHPLMQRTTDDQVQAYIRAEQE
ncbi:CheR family methyltransferase [Cellvibrio japonicus]|nr:protein-glutamate O-methyltransferase CheR [Cellvibrio japonicus]QEI10830.1 protein-glutamate O-methyltransferase CheR [Cellvibrio japonicus]QEI14406.1 protein-glutamate O-methyltransferase CheR [Cellvibrio japonicus]QEI17984.1 protein-glutamate O-methyltransferase CheR [Cellvibrio japonicus]